MGKVNVIETVWIPVEEKINLAARLWMPKITEDTAVPAILEYIPYRRRDFTRSRDEAIHTKFAEAGYASLRVDIRGSGDSDGLLHDEYSPQELQDGLKVIEWIANQSWCDGSVGMMGKSWGAYNSLQIAALQPPALKAIIPVMGTDDRWKEDIHFRNGLMATDNFWWGSIMQLMNTSPPDRDVVGKKWKKMWLERLDSMSLWTKNWAENQTNCEMWQHGSVSQNYSDIKVPVFYITGWGDLFRDTPFRLAEHLDVPFKLIVGPWAHLYPHEAVPSPKIDFIEKAILWWDYWLKGKKNGIMDEPPLVFYEIENSDPKPLKDVSKGKWIAEKEWPSDNIINQKFYLNEMKLCNTAPPKGSIIEVNSPQHYGMSSGDITSFGILGDTPIDCRNDDGGGTTFRSAPIDLPINILGHPEVDITLTADRGQGFISALLIAEAPDGTQTLITRGFYNLMHRFSDRRPDKISVGEKMRITIALQGISFKVPTCHRLLLRLGSTYWPVIWPSPENVTLSIQLDACLLKVPVRMKNTANDRNLNFAEPKKYQNTAFSTVKSGKVERDFKIDLTTGEVTHRVFIDGGVFGPVGEVFFNEINTSFHDVSERCYRIHPKDPLSAKAEMKQTRRIKKENLDIFLETWSYQTSTVENFIIKAWCKCWENGKLVHSKDWDYSVARNGM